MRDPSPVRYKDLFEKGVIQFRDYHSQARHARSSKVGAAKERVNEIGFDET